MSPIDDKWWQCQWLGAPVDEGAGSGEGPMPDGRGRSRDHQNGSIYRTPQTGAREVPGGIRLKHLDLALIVHNPTNASTDAPVARLPVTIAGTARNGMRDLHF